MSGALAFGYGLQLFFDFAGYSHVAIGAAQVLGFTVPENFASAIRVHYAFDILDTLAHVALVLDSRLRVPSPGGCCDGKCGGEIWPSSFRWLCLVYGTRGACCSCCGVATTEFF